MQAIRAAARPLTLSAARTAAVPRVAAGQSHLLVPSARVFATDALSLPPLSACVCLNRSDSAWSFIPAPRRTRFPARARLCRFAVSPGSSRTLVPPTSLASPPTPAPPPPLELDYQTVRFAHSAAESYDDFNARYADFFANTQDLFELQRGLNNCFAYDLVPSQRGQSPPLSPLSLFSSRHVIPARCLRAASSRQIGERGTAEPEEGGRTVWSTERDPLGIPASQTCVVSLSDQVCRVLPMARRGRRLETSPPVGPNQPRENVTVTGARATGRASYNPRSRYSRFRKRSESRRRRDRARGRERERRPTGDARGNSRLFHPSVHRHACGKGVVTSQTGAAFSLPPKPTCHLDTPKKKQSPRKPRS